MAFKCYGNLVNESFLAGIVFRLLLVFMFFFPLMLLFTFACMFGEEPRLMLSSSVALCCSFWDRASCWTWSSTAQLDGMANELQVFAWLWVYRSTLWLFLVSGDLNSDPHACMAISSLPSSLLVWLPSLGVLLWFRQLVGNILVRPFVMLIFQSSSYFLIATPN